MAELAEYYVDTQTGRKDLPLYDLWFKWAKFVTNWTTAVLALDTLAFQGTSLTGSWNLLACLIVLTILRSAEVAKETLPIFLCGQSFVWIERCCRRKDIAREADKLEKYLSCLILAPITAGVALALFALHHTVTGCLAVGLVGLTDFCMGGWVVYTDEWKKDFHRVRPRPDEFELDDNMDPYESEDSGLNPMGFSHLPVDQHPQVQRMAEKARLSSSLPVQKSDVAQVAILFASDDDEAGGKSALI